MHQLATFSGRNNALINALIKELQGVKKKGCKEYYQAVKWSMTKKAGFRVKRNNIRKAVGSNRLAAIKDYGDAFEGFWRK